MNKIGFIGYGHMGSVMLTSLLSSRAIEPEQVIISTRTKSKLDGLKKSYPAIEIAENNQEVAKRSTLLFLCVGTYQVKDVLSEIKDAFATHKHLVTISGGLEIASVEQIFNGPVTKIMPTIISEVHKGVTLICHNHKVMESEQQMIYQIFCKIGQVKIIQEHQFEIGADFTSCSPGLLASICDQFVQAGIKKSDLTYEEASEMLLNTLYGTAELLQQNNENFKALIKRVANKGGATEAGVSIFEAQLPVVFEEVFTATLERHEARKEMTRQQFMKK